MRDEFEVADILANRSPQLMAECQASKRLSFSLPCFGERLEPDVLGEEHPAKLVGANQEFFIGCLSRTVFDSGQNVHTTAAQLTPGLSECWAISVMAVAIRCSYRIEACSPNCSWVQRRMP